MNFLLLIVSGQRSVSSAFDRVPGKWSQCRRVRVTSITALALSDPCQSRDKVLLEVGGVWGTQDRVGWATLSVNFPRLGVLGKLAFRAHDTALLVELG